MPPTNNQLWIAPIFLGIIINWCLVGCLVVQVYTYHVSSLRDRIGLKFLVFFVFLADIVQTGIATDYAWKTLVVAWGDTGLLLQNVGLNSPKTAASLPVVNGIISATVQIFFAWRIWFLNQTTIGHISAISIGTIAVLQSLGCIILSSIPVFDGVELVTLVLLACNFVADILIAAFMLYSLRKARRQSLHRGTQTIISRLMVLAIETGAVTAVAAGVELVLLFYSNYYQAITFTLGQLFSNVFLANLNARVRTQRLDDDAQFSDGGLGSLGHAHSTLRFAIPSNQSQSGIHLGGDADLQVGVD